MATDWRAFEELVARIEAALVPNGALVKSPDRIKDLVTGRAREVDASIRFTVGSTPILITVDCRKRRGVQDDTWIEQLATKRAKIGAAKTIAVSAKGFSTSAMRSAQVYGIELRTLEDRIGEEIVQQFLSGLKVSLIVTEYTTRTIAFELDDGTALSVEHFGEDLATNLKSTAPTVVVAHDSATGQALTVEGLMRRVDDHDVPDYGAVVTKHARFSFTGGALRVSTASGPRLLRSIEIVADFTRRVVPAPAKSMYEYSSPERSIQHTLEAVGELSGSEDVRVLVDISSPTLERPLASAETHPSRATPEPRRHKP